MKNTIRRLCSMIVALVLVLSCAVTAFAAETFNAGVKIQRDGNKITVTVSEDNDEFLAAQSPRLSIVCNFDVATVTLNGRKVDSVLKDGMISFPVTAGGSYVITGSGEAGCIHEDGNRDDHCDRCGCNLGATMDGYIVGLKDNINMNCYLTLSDEVAGDENAYLQITRPDGSVNEIFVKDAVTSGKHYVFTEEFAAKEMTETVTIRMIMGDGTTSQTYRYSLRSYAEDILDNTATYTEEDRKMVKAMLLYGNYAQLHFDHRKDDLAGAELDLSEFSLEDVGADDLKAYADDAKQGTDKVAFMGSSLLLKSETVLRLFFKVDPSVLSKVTFTLNGQSLTPKASGSYYYVDVENISAKNLDADVTVAVRYDGVEAKITYNPMSYCYQVLANRQSYDESLCNVVKALYLYNQTAKAYFGALGR